MALLAWVMLGLIAGMVAKMLYPGHQGGNIFTTIALGIVGSMVGGYLAQALLGIGGIGVLTVGGILSAIAGSMLVIFVWYLVVK